MIIGFLGKGGSGKSSVTWLTSMILQEAEKRVLAVDADHNMDLAHLLQVVVDDESPTLHRSHDRFLKLVGQTEDKHWQNIVLDDRELPVFTLEPKDSFTQSVSHSVSPLLDLVVVGLGAADVLFSSRCAHGHSAPLKYYLPLLALTENQYCVIDGVAGVDMMNFGLFAGADVIVVVVEPHPNSIRVYREVFRIAKQCGLPVFALINKSRPGAIREELVLELGDYLIGELPLDAGVLEYDFAAVGNETKRILASALEKVASHQAFTTGLQRLRAFEIAKLKAKENA